MTYKDTDLIGVFSCLKLSAYFVSRTTHAYNGSLSAIDL